MSLPLVLLCAIVTLNPIHAAKSSSLAKYSPSPPISNESKLTLATIEDVEMLTYFLLWKHDYFDNFPDSDQEENQTNLYGLSESNLGEFIEKLKINHLMVNSHAKYNLSKSCERKTLEFMTGKNWWPPVSHGKMKQICETAKSCKSAKELIQLVSPNLSQQLTLSQSIARLCPMMLFQLQENECVELRESNFKSKNKPSQGAIWGFGLLFVTIVSFCSLAGVGVLPFLTDSSYEIMLTVLQGLAVGSLVGSALFHLIPQAFNLVTVGNHDYLWRSLIIFGGIYLFFWSERIMKIISEFRRRKKLSKKSIPSTTSVDNNDDKYRQVCFEKSKPEQVTSNNDVSRDSKCEESNHLQGENHLDHHGVIESRERSNSNFLLPKNEHAHSHNESNEIATIAWMIIFGDGLHNFIDGITIGAAFSQSILEGLSISVAVICEEFPHELGDFAILIGSGMPMRKALCFNFISACTCYFGLVVGILLGDLADATPYVFALAGGMFLYISLVDMMGELSAKLEIAGKKGLTFTAQMLLLQNVGILLGVSIMFFLAKYSDRINFEGLAPLNNAELPFKSL